MAHTPGNIQHCGKVEKCEIGNFHAIGNEYEVTAYCAHRDDATLYAAAPDLLAALQQLFEHCAMTHKHWGEGCNRKEADAAVSAGLSAIAKATGK